MGCDVADDFDESGGNDWDTALAASFLGKYVIAGFIYIDAEGNPSREPFQLHGVIVDAAPGTGFTLSLRGKRLGETVTLPAKLDAFVPASPGRYRLKSTNEVVYDPDYTSLWTMPATH
jgi:hypothetical protein